MPTTYHVLQFVRKSGLKPASVVSEGSSVKGAVSQPAIAKSRAVVSSGTKKAERHRSGV